jgi:hypothetical protein
MKDNREGMGPDQAPCRSIEHETVVKKIDFESFKEKQALETLRIMLHQMTDSVVRNTETTDNSAYNRFNAKAFLVDLDAARAHVVREFTCTKE